MSITQEDYLKELSTRIRDLPDADRAELLADYQEHFRAGRERGKSEAEICRSLGSPKSVAQAIRVNTLVVKAESSPAMISGLRNFWRILMAILILAPFNFIMLVCPFLVLFMAVAVGWLVPAMIATLSVFAFVTFLQSTGVAFGLLMGLSLTCMFLGALGLAVVSALLMFALTKLALQILISYARWNVEFINSRRVGSNQQPLGA